MFVVGGLSPQGVNLIRPDKQSAAFAAPPIAELVIGPMLLRILRILAVASRRAADVILLADASRMQRSEIGKLAFDFCNTVLNIGMYQADSLKQLSAVVNKK